jgi:superfamily II DNA helicase RecQ
MITLTATANGIDKVNIKQSLHMNNAVEVIGNADRRNIFYSKIIRENDERVSYETILRSIANILLELNVNFPLTIIYLLLRWCGSAYKLFASILGKAQYYPVSSDPIPERRLYAEYHAPQTLAMKEMILAQLTSKFSTIRVVFATVAIGMGVDIPGIRKIIHVGSLGSVQQYCQETGRARRDGLPSKVVLYYNNRDIGKNRHIGQP